MAANPLGMGPEEMRSTGYRMVDMLVRDVLPFRGRGDHARFFAFIPYNLTALACARETTVGPMSDDLVVYVPDQAHSSVAHAARVLGFRPDQVRVLPVGKGFRLQPETLRAAIAADVAAGRRPFFVSASGGATNTGAVDPLPESGAAGARARGLRHHGPAQVALPGVRGRPRRLRPRPLRLPARARRHRAATSVRDRPGVPARRRTRGRGGQLRRPRPPA